MVYGGFFFYGMSGVLSVFLIVMFFYGGVELIGVVVMEIKDVKNVLLKVIKGIVW